MEPCSVARSFQLKQRAVIEFLTPEGVTPKKIHRRIQTVYGEMFSCIMTVQDHKPHVPP